MIQCYYEYYERLCFALFYTDNNGHHKEVEDSQEYLGLIERFFIYLFVIYEHNCYMVLNVEILLG